MKRIHLSRTLLSVLLAAAVLLAAVPAGLAEETCNVSLDLNLKKNLMLAKYGMTVFLDDVQLAYLPQGGRLIRIVNLPKGIHTLHFYPEKGDGVSPVSMDVYVGKEMLITLTVQTHRKYMKVNSLSMQIGPQETYQFDDQSEGGSWEEVVSKIILWTMKYGMEG